MLLTTNLPDRLKLRISALAQIRLFGHQYDHRKIWSDLTHVLASCVTQEELELAVPALYREVFSLRSASLYVYNRGIGAFVRTGSNCGPGRLTPSPLLMTYFLGGDRLWNVDERTYAPDEEEASFVRASRARLVLPLVCSKQIEGLIVVGAPSNGEALKSEEAELMKMIAQQAAWLLAAFRLREEVAELNQLGIMAKNFSFVLHDLKNLTHGLALVADNAAEHGANPEFQRDSMAAMRETLSRMKHLIHKLKQFPNPMVPVCTDIRSVAEDIVGEFIRSCPHAVLQLKGEPAMCAIDPAELRTVIENLVQNGLDAAGGAGTITIETGPWRDGIGFLRVTDSGEGMTEEFMTHELFRPFRSTKKNGLGIGLYQCRQVVERLGGAVRATSARGQGSSFTVTLPLARAKQDAVPAIRNPAGRQATTRKKQGTKKGVASWKSC